MTKLIDIAGQKFNRWTALEYKGERKWLCRCECGNEREILSFNLKNGKSKSCGCLHTDVVGTHLLSGTLTYKRFHQMWWRIKNKPEYAHLSVCEEWKDLHTFISDMGECPSNEYSLDRIDNTKGYSPENCRWATMKQQGNNRSVNIFIEYNGERKTIAEWSDKTGLLHSCILKRFHRGLSPAEILSTKKRRELKK
jgi:hypothetical protein